MKLVQKIPPVQEPFTAEEIQSYLRLSSEQENGLLPSLIAAARAHVENVTGRSLLKQQWQLDLKPPYPIFSPLVKRIEKQVVVSLPKPPLLEVESLTLGGKAIPFTVEGSTVILSPLFWEKDLILTFWAGYGETADSLPPDLKMAILMTIRSLYDNQPVNLSLLKPFKVFHVV